MFLIVANRTFSFLPQSFISKLPRSVRAARSCKSGQTDFTRYVCCRSCYSIYPWDDCINKLDSGEIESKVCSFKRFPHHPQLQHRHSCGTTLMKKTLSTRGKIYLHPWLIYCFKSVRESLSDMLQKPSFIEKCELWKQRTVSDGVYSDVYDGQVWKDFLNYDGVPFLSAPFNFGLHLNVDWFQPFDRTQHSEGAVYLSILNLPRQERFLKENVILVGIIPGPKEPELLMNSFLQPLVDELKALWEGVVMYTTNKAPVMVRAALLCVGCDIPAARKVCGFLGHRATMGCSKCLLPFPTKQFGEKPNYSNFDRHQWKPRMHK